MITIDCHEFYLKHCAQNRFSPLRQEINFLFKHLGIDSQFVVRKEIIDNVELNCVCSTENKFEPIPIEKPFDDLQTKRWLFYEKAIEIVNNILEIDKYISSIIEKACDEKIEHYLRTLKFSYIKYNTSFTAKNTCAVSFSCIEDTSDVQDFHFEDLKGKYDKNIITTE